MDKDIYFHNFIFNYICIIMYYCVPQARRQGALRLEPLPLPEIFSEILAKGEKSKEKLKFLTNFKSFH